MKLEGNVYLIIAWMVFKSLVHLDIKEFHKMMKSKSRELSDIQVLLVSCFKHPLTFTHTLLVFIIRRHVTTERPQLILIHFSLLGLALRTIKTIGLCKIHGAQGGVCKGLQKLPEEKILAE